VGYNFGRSGNDQIYSSSDNDPMRRLANKQQKAYLYVLQDGFCADCCCLLSDFQADHIVPWSCGGTTHIRNMQLLCPRCHKTKTSTDLSYVKRSKS